MPRELKPKAAQPNLVETETAQPRTRQRTGDSRNAVIGDRVKELRRRVVQRARGARHELDAVLSQLQWIGANLHLLPPEDAPDKLKAFQFRSKVERLMRIRPPAVPIHLELIEVCVVVAESGWHLLPSMIGQSTELSELAHLLRQIDADQIEADQSAKGSREVAPPRKNRHTDGKVENRTSSRALLAESVRELSARLESCPADRQWLLETLPLECGAIAAAFNEDAKYQGMLDQLTAEQIGTKLRNLREERGLTQQQLAELAGTYSQNISEHERGIRTPQVDTVKAYAAALGVATGLLLSE